MTHIAVERNRTKQMNEHLAALRSMMPESYCQRVDQASTIGSAINFVKELEYRIQRLDARKHLLVSKTSYESSEDHQDNHHEQHLFQRDRKSPAVVAKIEASMVESHANLKIRARRWPKQLLRLIARLQSAADGTSPQRPHSRSDRALISQLEGRIRLRAEDSGRDIIWGVSDLPQPP